MLRIFDFIIYMNFIESRSDSSVSEPPYLEGPL